MPLSHDVRLPIDQQPRFPAMCPGCGVHDPRDLIIVASRRSSWTHLFAPILWLFARRVGVEVPACAECVTRNRRQRLLQLAVLVTAACAALFVVSPWIKSMGLSRGVRRFVTLGLVLLVLAPLLVWSAFCPPLVDITVGKRTVDYEFANRAYAAEFAKLNHDTVV